METEYYVAFSDVVFEGKDITSRIINEVQEYVAQVEDRAAFFPYDICREKVSFIGEINVLKTKNRELADILHDALEEFKEKGLDLHIFPITSNED